ncbi:hypothetical protein MUK42_07230 [Musa troglodytarum]|uniref:Uncharacterized protein n=1 Tax=Musa troglodytarum TaxID=320322 RepID=A0A9E7K6L5_9LILI|nr:hypothetical protein MUK42_07230 [Musa troglodytarum]
MQQRSAAVGRMARISPAAWSSISGTSKVAKGKSRLGVRSPPSKFESFAAIAVSVGFISLVIGKLGFTRTSQI